MNYSKKVLPKQIMAVSTTTYRTIAIYELPKGFAFFLDVWFHSFPTLQEATEYIDKWNDLKKN